MKKTIEIVADFCDQCGERCDPYHPCLSCGVLHCYECRKTSGKEYAHGIYFSGSLDGYYCADCDVRLTISGRDLLHAAYRRIESLRRENQAWGEDFGRRSKQAEESLKALWAEAEEAGQPRAEGYHV